MVVRVWWIGEGEEEGEPCTLANRAKPPRERLREVYTDESYIHER
jgi:hypothetical protein